MHRLLNTMLMIKQHSLKVKQFMRLQLTFFSLHRALRLLLTTYSTSKLHYSSFYCSVCGEQTQLGKLFKSRFNGIGELVHPS